MSCVFYVKKSNLASQLSLQSDLLIKFDLKNPIELKKVTQFTFPEAKVGINYLVYTLPPLQRLRSCWVMLGQDVSSPRLIRRERSIVYNNGEKRRMVESPRRGKNRR